MKANILTVIAVAAMAVGCAGDGSLDGTTAELVPAGSNATFTTNTIPSVLAPGERVVVTVTAINTGATPGFNDWKTSAPQYTLWNRSTPGFGWAHTPVSAAVPVGGSHTFAFVITAPSTPGAYTFQTQMSILSGGGFFGPLLSVPITVDGGTTPGYACAFEPGLSSIPATIPANSNRSVTVVVRNTGTATWASTGFRLDSQNSPQTLWGFVRQSLATSVGPGATASFTFTVRAPSTAGTHPFRFDMSQFPGINAFGSTCVNTSIDVTGSADLANSVSGNSFPATMAPGEARAVSISFLNTGSETWTAGTAFAITSQTSPTNLFGTVQVFLTANTAPGAVGTFNFGITAPTSPGSYTAIYRMRKLTGSNAGYFGETFSTPVTVDGSASPSLNAALASHTIPTRMTAGSNASVTVTMTNTGTATWMGTGFRLTSVSSPSNLFGWVEKALGASETVAPGGDASFTFVVTAPATAGNYTSSWRTRSTAAGFFGATLNAPVEVTLCGNGTINAGETCDDGNLTPGDGCSDFCQNDPTIAIDAATETGGRAFTGGTVGAVVVGDVTGDSALDVMVGRVEPPTGVTRVRCGVVYGFSGGAGFFTSTTDIVPADAGFAIVGAEAEDQLATYGSGLMVVGDITGDGIDDLIVGAPGADGPANARADAGEVYVIAGSSGLTTAGTIDLAASPGSVHLAATIYGALAGDRLTPVAIGDITGDGFNDLILGAPQAGVGGSTIGRVQILVGSATGLSGTIDLASPGGVSLVTVSGTQPGDTVALADVGNFAGDATLDLLVVGRSTNNVTNDGAVWGFVGPIMSDRTIGMVPGGADMGWIGANSSDRMGSSVAIGDVQGDVTGEVLIGIRQYQRAPGVQSGAIAIFEGPVAPGLYDLSLSVGSIDTLILGAEQYDDFSSAMALGDITGDGRLDIIACARAADGPTGGRDRAGECSAIRGSSGLSGTLDLAVPNQAALVFYGAAAIDLIGGYRNTLSAGDIDGDGRVDFCVGTPTGRRVNCVRSPF